jgi:ABC-type polysaccharide/polyol phosphate export permease
MKLSVFLKKLKTRFFQLFTKSNWNLIVELIRFEFKVADRNSILGILWSFLGPLAMLTVMYFIFRTRFGQGIRAYPLYLLLGIVCVSFFVTVTTYMLKIFFLNRDTVLNSTVPRESIILSNLSIHSYKFIIELAFCFLLGIFYGLFTWKLILLLLPLLVAYLGLVLGTSLLLSLFYCFARDIEHIWMIASRILFFVTPIFYTLDRISPLARKIVYWGNPLTPFLISFRQVFMGELNLPNYIYSLFLGSGFFIIGYYVFIVLENIALERA